MGKARMLPVLSGILCLLITVTAIVPATAHGGIASTEPSTPDIQIVPLAPLPGSVYAATPGYIDFEVQADTVISEDDVDVSIDHGPPGHPADYDVNRFGFNLTSPLSIGEHKVNVSVTGEAAFAEWTFEIVEDPGVAPYLILLSPTDGSTLDQNPDQVRVQLIQSHPSSQEPQVTISYDGSPLPTYQDYNGNLVFYAVVPSGPMPFRSVPIVGEIAVDGRVIAREWNVNVGDPLSSGPSLNVLYPLPDSILTSPPSSIRVEVIRGDPPVSVDANSIEVYLDGMLIEGGYTAGNIIRASITSSTTIGTHHVKVVIDTDGGQLMREWDFVYHPADNYDLERVQYGDEYSILAPASWTVERDKDISGNHFDLVFTGPQVDGFYQNVNVQSGTVSGTDFSYSYMSDYLNQTKSALALQGINVEAVGALDYSTVGDLTIGIWKLHWSGYGLMDAQAFLAEQSSGRIWVITCTASEGSFDAVWPTFQSMITSLEVGDGGPYSGYTHYVRAGDYDLMVPDGWTTQADYESGGMTFSLFITGPQDDGFTVNILLQNGTDYSVKEDQTYLKSQVNDRILKGLEDQGVYATIYEQPTFRTISNHTAMAFSVHWTTKPIIQQVVIIVDGEHHRYWVFTCSASENTYDKYSETFDTVVDSFNVTSTGGGSFDPFSGGFPILLIGGAAAAVILIAIVAVAVLGARRRA